MKTVVLLVFLALTACVSAQVTPTPSITATISGTITGSQSITASSSYSITATNSGTPSGSATLTGTATVTHPLPPAPTALVNYCKRPDGTNHIYYLCLGWTDSSGLSVSFKVTYTPAGGSGTTLQTTTPYQFIGSLTPNTVYTISIVGIDNAGRVSLPLVGTLKTDPLDAKTAYKTNDLQSPACNLTLSPTTYRNVIYCKWGAPPIAPLRIDVKCHCVSKTKFQKNKIIHKVIPGASLNVSLPISRTNSKCTVEIFGDYINHLRFNGRGHVFKFIVNVP